MRTVLNLLWLVFSGLWLAIGYAPGRPLSLCVPGIITIPFGVACFRLSAFVLWPFGRAVVRKPEAGAPSTVANVLWFVLAGLWMALAHLVLGVLLCLTIIGIPLGLGNFKLAAVAVAPLGKEIVSSSDPRAQAGSVVFCRAASSAHRRTPASAGLVRRRKREEVPADRGALAASLVAASRSPLLWWHRQPVLSHRARRIPSTTDGPWALAQV